MELISLTVAVVLIVVIMFLVQNKAKQKSAQERRGVATAMMESKSNKPSNIGKTKKNTNSKGYCAKHGYYFDENDIMYDDVGNIIETALIISLCWPNENPIIEAPSEVKTCTVSAAIGVVGGYDSGGGVAVPGGDCGCVAGVGGDNKP